jgi:hypothetical protein
VIPPEFLPRHREPDDPGPELCDFCTVRTLTLAGAMKYRQDRTVTVRGVYAKPIPGGLMLGANDLIYEAGEWAACAVCVPVVARRDPDVLANHVLSEWIGAGRPPSPTDLARLQAIYRAVLPVLGPPRRVE